MKHTAFFLTALLLAAPLTGFAADPAYYRKQATWEETIRVSRESLAAKEADDEKPPKNKKTDARQKAAVRQQLWELVLRDFPGADDRDGIWSGDWKTGDFKLLANRYVKAMLGPLQQEARKLAATAASPGDLENIRKLYRQSCVFRDALTRLEGVDPQSVALALGDMARTWPDRCDAATHRKLLDALKERDALLAALRVCKTNAAARADELVAEARAALLANPLLSPGKLLFVKRHTYTPGWYYAEFMRATKFGGGLCVLSLPDGKVTELFPQLRDGITDRYDLSFDGQRVVFGYKSAPDKAFRLYEARVDGTGLRQLTFDPPDEAQRVARFHNPKSRYYHTSDDFHPCYLPDGGIVFASARCERGVLCDQGDDLAVNLLYRVDADGSNLRRLSEGALSESTPSVMNDGRILYTRWEYVDKGVIAVQSLWAMRPDGSGSCEIYGNDIEDPMVFIHGRAIPGQNNLFVCTGTFHHPFAVGPILLVDINKPLHTLEPIHSLTPDTRASSTLIREQTGAYGEKFAHLRDGKWVADNKGPLFSEPYPLADPETNAGAGKYFLVNCNPDQPWGHASAYGLWLIDVFGNRVRIHSDPQISCWQPMPLRPRKTPPLLTPTTTIAEFANSAIVFPPASQMQKGGRAAVARHSNVETSASQRPLDIGMSSYGCGTLLLTDVYRGLDGVPRGAVKYLRVLEQVPRPWSAHRFWADDSALGQHAPISLYAHIFVKVNHGVVPVHDDGSAHFTVPARRNIFLQALDENFMEVQRMRTFVNLQPGETRGCVGCHEGRPNAARVSGRLRALAKPAVAPAPQPGETVPRTIHYVTDVQPVLDRHCVRCHGGAKPDGGLDLTGALTQLFNRSYENIMKQNLLSYVTEFVGPTGSQPQFTNVVPLPPRALGSHASKFIAAARGPHHGVKLPQAELLRLITWADANGPYYGTYFGRRNLVHKDHPNFRPVPTLASALGDPSGTEHETAGYHQLSGQKPTATTYGGNYK
jgi:hypothetical protein